MSRLPAATDVLLRDVVDTDFEHFTRHMQDAEGIQMAAFTPVDSSDDGLAARWQRIRIDPTVTMRTVVCGGAVAGHVASYKIEGEREVTFWLDRTMWGSGVATRALELFLAIDQERPLFARAAVDNLGSIRVLEKSGFARIGRASEFAHGRGHDVEQFILRLEG